MPLDSTVARVTDRIRERSRDSRGAYLERIAKAAAKPLATLALGTPLAETTSDLYAGRVALAEGKRRRAARLLRRALERADRHGMRLDAGMARRALARALDGAAARAIDDEGRAILEDIGARRHLEG